MTAEGDLVKLIQVYGKNYDSIAQRCVARITEAWLKFGGPTDADLANWLRAVLPIMEGAELSIATLVDAYLSRYTAIAVGGAVSPVGIEAATVTGAALRSGTLPSDVYKRAVVEMRTALSEGLTRQEASTRALARATNLAETDVALAHRASAQQVMESRGFKFYRRALTGRSCVLCAVASTQRYRTGNLMPIHSHCDCRIVPEVAAYDPGQVINRPLLNRLKESGALGDLSLQQSASRARSRSRENRDKAAEYRRQAEAADNDTDRRKNLERAQSWDERATKQEGLADKYVAQRQELGGTSRPRTIEVHEHGELGPVLTDASHSFTGEDQIAA